MSKQSEIDRLINGTGAMSRSAHDPWKISHGYQNHSRSRNSVAADLGQPQSDLTSAIQNSEQVAASKFSGSQSAGPSAQSSGGSGFLDGLLNLFPVASGIAKLFGFGGSAPPPGPVPYAPPPSINFTGAVSESGPGVTSLSYGADGLARASTPRHSTFEPYSPAGVPNPVGGGVQQGLPVDVQSNNTLTAQSSAAPSYTSPGSDQTSAQSGAKSNQSILVQVQAMDSQSFMDHSHEIAQAVRQAMLNLHSVNDVIADL